MVVEIDLALVLDVLLLLAVGNAYDAFITKKNFWIRIRKSANMDYTDHLDFTASTFG